MNHLYPHWFIPAAIAVIAAEGIGAWLVFKLSRGIAAVLCGLMILQAFGTLYVITAPAYLPGAADLGGANLGPAIVAFFGFWGSILVLAGCGFGVGVLMVGKWKDMD